jgi:5-dehydro-2-deoxygluconokinase
MVPLSDARIVAALHERLTMTATERQYDLITMGRSSIDLYANEVGAPFVEIKSFAAYVGGSPTNIAVGARRLGLSSAVLTAVGEDPVGDFVLNFLKNERVEAQFVLRKPGTRTSAVVLGIEPPDKFPLVYYRDNCADNQLSIDDVLKTPIQDCRVFEFSGTGLSKEPSRSATIFAAEQARAAGATVVLDLDFRPNQWHDARAFGVTVRSVLPVVDIVLGTEDECKAVTLTDPTQVNVTHSQISGARVAGDLDAAVETMRRRGPKVVVVKRGEKGATVFEAGRDPAGVPGFPVEIYNVLGAGDAFAAGFIYGLVKNWDYFKAARMGNAGGAIVVTRHGCANFMAYEEEALKFIADHGGF